MKDDILGAMGPQGPQIDPMAYPQITCDKCGHSIEVAQHYPEVDDE